MAWYKCFVRGQGFPLTLDGETRIWSFYVNRFVEAGSEAEAETAVVALLRTDTDLSLPQGISGREEARVFIEEIVPVDGPSGPNSGFTFFDDPGIQFYED